MRTKSLMLSVRICEVQRTHKCKGNKNHVIYQGDFRLEVKHDRNWDKYCLECGNKISLKLQNDSSTFLDEFRKYYP